jgi:hypothetical protein
MNDDQKTTDRLLREALTALAVLAVVSLGAAVYMGAGRRAGKTTALAIRLLDCRAVRPP